MWEALNECRLFNFKSNAVIPSLSPALTSQMSLRARVSLIGAPKHHFTVLDPAHIFNDEVGVKCTSRLALDIHTDMH